MIKVLFFASLRDRLNCDFVEVDFQKGLTLFQIKEILKRKNKLWRFAMSENLLSSVEQEMVVGDYELSDGMEVAFFPPVTGG